MHHAGASREMENTMNTRVLQDKNAVVFDVDDEDLFRVAQRAVALAKEKYDATFR